VSKTVSSVIASVAALLLWSAPADALGSDDTTLAR
jgi:hypothetical protein